MDRGSEWRHTQKQRAEDFGIWKKAVSWDLNSERESWDSILEEGRWFLVSPRWDQLGSTKCAVCLLKKLCLSLLMSKNLKLKKINKSFVPEPILCFSDSYMRMNICERFLYLYEYVYFTYMYEHYECCMYMYITRIHILVIFLDVALCYRTAIIPYTVLVLYTKSLTWFYSSIYPL